MRITHLLGVGAALAVVLPAAPAGAFYVVGPTQVPDPTLTQDINVPDPTVNFNVGAPVGVLNASPINGVITSWRVYSGGSSAGAGMQLRVIQNTGGGMWKAIRSDAVQLNAAALPGKATEQSYATRLPIAAGESIAVQRTRPTGANLATLVYDHPNGSAFALGWFFSPDVLVDGGEAKTPSTVQDGSGSPGSDPFVPLSAVVEADADGDGFGDETQDRCPGSAGATSGCPTDAFAVPAAPARGATVIGPTVLTPNVANIVASARPATSVVTNVKTAAGMQGAARWNGVITQWSFYTGDVSGTATAQLRTLRRSSDSGMVFLRSGPVEPLSPGTGPATLRTFPARVPVGPGDQIALGLTRDAAGTLNLALHKDDATPSAWDWGQLLGSVGTGRVVADGEVGYFGLGNYSPATLGTFVPLSAVVERDADGDLFGDNTQDRCPDTAGTVDGCPAPVVDPPMTQQPQQPQQPAVQVVTVVPASAAAVVDSARVAFTAGRRTLTVPLSCPKQTARACAGRVTARTSAKYRVGRRLKVLSLGASPFRVAQGAAGTVGLKVPAATRTALVRAKAKRVKVVVTLATSASTTKTVG